MSVPSFGSFQPSAKDRNISESKKNRRKKKKHKGSDRFDRAQYDSSSKVLERQLLDDNGSRTESEHGPSVPWVTDLKGDPLNLQYGSLHSRSVPRYRFIGHGRVVGLGTELRRVISGQCLQLTFSKFGHPPSVDSRRFRKLISSPQTRLWKPEVSNLLQSEPSTDFVPLERSMDFTRSDESDYQLPTEKIPDEGWSSSSDSETGPYSIKLPTEQLVSREFEYKLTEEPSCVAAWLGLLNHSLQASTDSRRNSRAAVAVSILQRALKAAPSNVHSFALWCNYLFWGEELWEASKLQGEWDKALGNVHSDHIWLNWLNYRLRISRTDIQATIVSDGSRCLQSIINENVKLLAFWRLLTAFQEAGYTEQATALMQAQCELYVLSLWSLGLSLGEQLNALEHFWESETPRLGEPCATGWINAVGTNIITAANRRQESTVPTRGTGNADPYIRWAVEERVSERRMPTHSSEHEGDDPYSTILFSDIRDLVIRLTCTESRNALKRIWLSILGLHIPGFFHHLFGVVDESLSIIEDFWPWTQFRRHSYFEALYAVDRRKFESGAHAGSVLGDGAFHSSGFGLVKECGYNVLDPLEGIDVHGKFRTWESQDVEGIDVPTTRLLFERLKESSDPEWDQLEMAFEAALDPKRATSMSRGRLKQTQGSLKNWHVHALLELLSGKLVTAAKIYENVLSDNKEGSDRLVLWSSYARLKWLTGTPEELIDVVCRGCGCTKKSVYSGLDVLRAKQSLDDLLDSHLARNRSILRALVRLRYLLELATGSVESMLSMYDSQIGKIHKSPGVSEELVLTEVFLLLRRHVILLRNPFPRSVLRKRVADAVRRYPNNLVLLDIFLECEQGEGVWGRVRDLISERNSAFSQGADGTLSRMSCKSAGRMVWEIWVVTRWFGAQKLSDEAHRLRHLFSEWSEEVSGRNSSVFWRLWIELELRLNRRDTAKALLLRAVSHCPPDKELYLLPFGPLRTEFRARDLNDWVDLMIEKGIRLRKELAPYLLDWKEDMEVDGQADEQEMDEVERQAAEYRRLLPYR